ncbi:hypothetical protein OG984_02680 [Nocardioides sp. NBC_00368]|uniref:hypothetical protein n=1 Tax=Nocardioides sp. NBC_00368 TaxID=2976000 RepID=UPI002E1B7473
MPGPPVKVSIGDWLASVQEACTDQLNIQFSADELARLKHGQDKMVFGGYLMGTSDQAGTVKGVLEDAELGDHKIGITPQTQTEASPTAGPPSDPSPLTVGALRTFLACRPDLPDDLPVVVGGVDWDDHDRMFTGLADAIWSDGEGAFGGRLCIAAMTLGLVDED